MKELYYKVFLEAMDARILACEKRIVELEAQRDELEAMLRHELLCHDSCLTETEVDEEIARRPPQSLQG